MENRIFKFVCDCIGIIIGVAIAVLFWTGVYYIVVIFVELLLFGE